MPREQNGSFVSFFIDAQGRPIISALSEDQKEIIDVVLDDLAVALLVERGASHLGNKIRERSK